MMRKSFFILVLLISLPFLFSCKRLKKTPAEIEREEWIASFSDSIEYYKNEITQLEERFNEVNSRVGTLLDNFEHYSNPRQVTGYYILKGWSNKVPLTKTGMYARINEDENLELIATLSGGNFNRISVSDARETLESNAVPYDQALNYRHNNLNTVCFTGTASDSIAEFIAINEPDKITLSFLEGSKSKSSLLPADEKNMIALTWELYSYKLETREMQKKIWVYSRKIDAYRRMMETGDSIRNLSSN